MSKNLSLEEFKILERRIHDEYPDISPSEFNMKVIEFMIMTLPSPESEPEIEEEIEEEIQQVVEEEDDDYTE